METGLSVQTDIAMFVVFAIIISYFIDKITPSNMVTYFLIIYDLQLKLISYTIYPELVIQNN